MNDVHDRSRRDLWLAIAVAWLLVSARSIVFVHYEHSFFDADQAIIGLMAKHLAEGRAFPLFYYGQTYMMGVDAWVAAPVFLIAGPTVAALHVALILVNLAVVTLLIVTLCRATPIGAWGALVASLPFTFAPPFTTANLIEAGANIGPFVYVILLWLTQARPLWFGAILAFGFQNREFTIYAVPALLAVQLFERRLFRADTLRTWLIALAAFCLVWEGIEALKPFADLMGPGTRGALVHGSAGSQVGNIASRIAVIPAEIPSRLKAMLGDHIPRLLGAIFVNEGIAGQGHDWLFWPVSLTLAFALMRTIQLRLGRAAPSASAAGGRTVAFSVYLMLVGAAAAGVYVATRPATGIVDRYLLLTLYLSIGILAMYLATERAPALKRVVVAVMLLLAGSSAWDHVQLFRHYHSGSDPDEMRVLADALVARRLHTAEANYWKAYKLTFLTQERVKIASTDVARIDEYQALAAAEGDRLMAIRDEPCPGGEQVVRWYLCRADAH